MHHFRPSRGRYKLFGLITTCILLTFTACSVHSNSEEKPVSEAFDRLENKIQQAQEQQWSDIQSALQPIREHAASVSGSAVRNKSLLLKSVSGYTIEAMNLPESASPVAFNNNGSVLGSIYYNGYENFFWNKEEGYINLSERLLEQDESSGRVFFALREGSLNNQDEVAAGASFRTEDNRDNGYAPFIWKPDEGFTFIPEFRKEANSEFFNGLVEIKAINDASELFANEYESFNTLRRSLYWNETDGVVSDPDWPVLRLYYANIHRLTYGLTTDPDLETTGLLLDMNTGSTATFNAFKDRVERIIPLKITDSGKIFSMLQVEGEFRPENRYGYVDGEDLVFYEKPEGAGGYFVRSINDQGTGVGYALFPDGGKGVIWNADGSYEIPDLNRLGVLLFINDHDEILAYLAEDEGFGFYLLSPNDGQDTTPPAIEYSREVESLWPPNHRMETVLTGIIATDEQDPDPEITIEVRSSESRNGTGDGSTDSDWEITQDSDGSYSVALRAERSGKGEGRLYTLTITAADASGNIAEEEILVSVDHDPSMAGRF